jgi:RNA polymerase sigma-70 factor, ECF subfamily
MNDVAPSVLARRAAAETLATKTPQPDGADSQGRVDDRLVARACAGDARALEALLEEARPRALAVALKVVRNPDDAEDAVQDAFVKVWRSLARFEGRASFTTWIHRIVVNCSLDLLRRQSCRPGLLVEEDGEEPRRSAPEPAHEETPEQRLAQAQTGAAVRGALEVLSPVHREALTLREFDDFSYEEIAVAVGCPIGTVMSRLHHARKRLADELRVSFAPPAGAASELLCAA